MCRGYRELGGLPPQRQQGQQSELSPEIHPSDRDHQHQQQIFSLDHVHRESVARQSDLQTVVRNGASATCRTARAYPDEDEDEHGDEVVRSGDGVLVGQTEEVGVEGQFEDAVHNAALDGHLGVLQLVLASVLPNGIPGHGAIQHPLEEPLQVGLGGLQALTTPGTRVEAGDAARRLLELGHLVLILKVDGLRELDLQEADDLIV
ncbi:hypothetical protein EYF80_003280 [Liparis tanakae]|uniref:Uncharacterized protein n=1 Tax=Liparis tanakae TaxID=230148 RepID=A0A4Z2J8S7_9TELE|nr:hypothetical protein EYF80_003280 [Liparis tanakae]